MYYNQLGEWQEISMPLLMGFTQPEPIQSAENFEPIIYDPVYQIVYDMRELGTKSLKISSTAVGKNSFKQDKKNEIDDKKTVK
jgi:hypothetical protein